MNTTDNTRISPPDAETESNLVAIYCDGLCEPNPGGIATFGWVAHDERSGMLVASKGAEITLMEGQTTNNIAEYCALKSALMWLKNALPHFQTHGRKRVVIRSDSQLVINQVSGKWACNSEVLWAYRNECRSLMEAINATDLSICLEWVPRERNVLADDLSRQAYRDTTGHEPPERYPRKKETAH